MLKMPVIALRDIVVMPGVTTFLEVERESTKAALSAAMASDQMIFAVAQRTPETEKPGEQDLFTVGTVAKVSQIAKMPKGIVRVILVGEYRATLEELSQAEEYLEASVLAAPEPAVDENSLESAAMLRSLQMLFVRYAQDHGKFNQQIVEQVDASSSLGEVIYQIAQSLPINYLAKQKILETNSVAVRHEALCVILSQEREILKIQKDISERVQEQVDQNQKEYYLREQLKAIHKELGDEDTISEADRFKQQLDELKAPKKVKEKIAIEISHYRQAGMHSAEANVIRGYIETLLAMPWKKTSKDNMDIAHAREVLDADHYGLEKVKERVLECLSVKKLKKDGQAPIICLVGPPGTGKTSIARSVARAMNRKYKRICLGGVRDEAEIRGHRRTYIGAMPGRLAVALKDAKVKNPLILLDEIDKLGSDAKGDPSSALLEVLDPEQNKHFSDHYIEIPLDLSQALFLCTANDINTIPRPLLDRMEVITLAGYTSREKFHIAKDHLWEKQKQRNGLERSDLTITDKALEDVVEKYTREAGVRGLERKIAQICRRAAMAKAEQGAEKQRVTVRNLEEYLGKPEVRNNPANEKPAVGVVRGLAWTQVGGDTLEIETIGLPGDGKLRLTGKLGDVMKESAQIALTLVLSRLPDTSWIREHDIHLHVPEGAVPKDGPSAGVTMSTALCSLLLGLPVRSDVAMTGEVTLTGRVLAIGGLKEKLLAARVAGMRQVIVPEQNRRDVEEFEEEVTQGLTITFVRDVQEVWKESIVGYED